MKIHIEKDYSYIEFETDDLPSEEELRIMWDHIPCKDTKPIGPNGLRLTPESAKKQQQREERLAERKAKMDPPATANQRRVLERYGEWKEGMTKSEASRVLGELGI